MPPDPSSGATPPPADDPRRHGDPARAATIRQIVLDVDGVLTDGRLVLSGPGPEPKTFHVRDGLAIRQFVDRVGPIAIVTGRDAPAVTARAAELGMGPVVQGAADKAIALRRVVAETGIAPEATAAMGDDLPDLPMLRACGYPLAPGDAVPEVLAVARFVTRANGGRGAVREAIEHLMRAAGRWHEVVAHFDPGHDPRDEGAEHGEPVRPNGSRDGD